MAGTVFVPAIFLEPRQILNWRAKHAGHFAGLRSRQVFPAKLLEQLFAFHIGVKAGHLLGIAVVKQGRHMFARAQHFLGGL